MATLATDSPRLFENGRDDYLNEIGAIAADIIYAGAAVGELNDSATGRPLASADKFLGFAETQCDNSAGAASDRRIRVKQAGRAVLSVTGVTGITDLHKPVYATDDDTFTLTVGGTLIGWIDRHVSGTKALVRFLAHGLRDKVVVTHSAQTTDAATDRAFFVADKPYYIDSITEVHSVAAGGASKLQITKDTSTDAPGAGTDLLTDNTAAGFDLNATANTPQYGTISTTAGVRKLAKGDRLSLDFADAIQSTAGLKVTVVLTPL